MLTRVKIRKNVIQILAITEKNTKLNLRYKFKIIVIYLMPIFTVLMPLIILSKLFELDASFGLWTEYNFLVFIFIAYTINLFRVLITEFPAQLNMEKFWKTLSALIIAPFNRFNLLFGIFLSNLILIIVPFCFLFIISYIIFPISILTLFFILIIYFIIALIFSGIGLIIGVFTIVNENIWKILRFLLEIIFWTSCLTYPFEIFPSPLQGLIRLNPLYYVFDFLRMAWVLDTPLIAILTYPIHFCFLILTAILIPFLSVVLFDKIYKKYGIVGY